MSEIKTWLADEANYSEETKRSRSHPDQKVRRLLHRHITRNRIECADGFSMSVQYSTFHYCNGRSRFMGGEMDSENDPLPEPKSVEIGFPSDIEPNLTEYAEEAWVAIVRWYHWPREDSLTPAFMDPWKDRPEWLVKIVKATPEWLRRLISAVKVVPNHTNTVYAWVPIEVVDQVLAKHGGIKRN